MAEIELTDADADPVTAPSTWHRPWPVPTQIAALVLAVAAAVGLGWTLRSANASEPPAAPATRTVTLHWSGGHAYTIVVGSHKLDHLPQGTPITVDDGSYVIVLVLGTKPGGQVSCSILVDGVTRSAENAFGLGAVAECDATVKDVR